MQPSSGRKDKLTLCVRLEDPIPDHATALLLEPRFLSPYIQKSAPKLQLPDHEAVTLLTRARRSKLSSDSKPVEIRAPAPSSPPPQSCSGGFLGFISWLVEAPKPEEEHPMAARSGLHHLAATLRSASPRPSSMSTRSPRSKASRALAVCRCSIPSPSLALQDIGRRGSNDLYTPELLSSIALGLEQSGQIPLDVGSRAL